MAVLFVVFGAVLKSQLCGHYAGVVAEDDGAFDDVFHFTNIAGPVVILHGVDGFGFKLHGGAVHAFAGAFEQAFGQFLDVTAAFP